MTIEALERSAAAAGSTRGSRLPVVVRGFRPDIQGLRAVAVLLVVLYHAGVPFVTGGFVGVDVFFVISGFLITQHLVRESRATGTVSLSRFYARRIRRLLPSALLVILVTVVVARIWGPALQAGSTASDGFFATFYGINYWLAIQGVDYQHAASAVSPLQHFWSLAVEEQFYLIWPVLIVLIGLLARRGAPWVRSVALLVVVVAIAVLSFRESATVTDSNAPLAYFSLQTRGWELAAGALVAIIAPLLARIPGAVAVIVSWAGLVAIVGSAFTFDNATPFPGVLAAVPVGGAVLTIVGGLVDHRGTAEVLLRPRPMQFLGTVSYGWYLWHWPVIVLSPFLFDVEFGWPENLEVSFLALWFAVLSYLILERPVLKRTLTRRIWFLRGGVASFVVASVALVAFVVPPASAGTGAAASSLTGLTATQLSSRLLAAESTDAVPANLTPTLERAATDTPVTSRDGCHVDYLTTTNERCVFGDTTASRTILLFGDSHAEQWFGAMDALARSEHWRLVSWTKAACPIADVALRSDVLKREYRECPAWKTRTRADIAALHPQLIVASQADSLPGPAFSNARWAAETATTVSALTDLAPTVMLLDTPHPVSDVPECLARNLSTSASCNVPASTEPSQRTLADRRQAVADALDGVDVSVIDPSSWFCTSTTCPAIVGNTLVYRDDSHMTQSYSRVLEPLLADALSVHLKEQP